MTLTDMFTRPVSRSETSRGFRVALARLSHRVAIARSRRDLARLDANRLEDIGIDHSAAEREAARGFWDAPDFWKAR